MKHWIKAGIFGLGLAFSGCKNGPKISECILTVDQVGLKAIIDSCASQGADMAECAKVAVEHSIIADCQRPDKSFYERHGYELDGYYLYTAEDRSKLLVWAKANCGSNDKSIEAMPTPSTTPSKEAHTQ